MRSFPAPPAHVCAPLALVEQLYGSFQGAFLCVLHKVLPQFGPLTAPLKVLIAAGLFFAPPEGFPLYFARIFWQISDNVTIINVAILNLFETFLQYSFSCGLCGKSLSLPHLLRLPQLETLTRSFQHFVFSGIVASPHVVLVTVRNR